MPESYGPNSCSKVGISTEVTHERGLIGTFHQKRHLSIGKITAQRACRNLVVIKRSRKTIGKPGHKLYHQIAFGSWGNVEKMRRAGFATDMEEWGYICGARRSELANIKYSS